MRLLRPLHKLLPYESQVNGCDHGICVESADWDAEDHRCSGCGECFEENEFCPSCGYCLDCCLNNADLAGCVHGICIESGEWLTHFCGEHSGCVEVLCDICGGCAGCCDKTRVQQNCTHTHVCPGSSGWSKHFCKTCNKCFAPGEMCQYCGKCLACCKAARPCSCETIYVRVTRNGSTTIAHRTEPASRNALTAHIHIRREAPMCRRTPTGIIRPVPFAVWR